MNKVEQKVAAVTIGFLLGCVLQVVLKEHPILWVIVPFLVGAAVIVVNEL